MRGHTVALQCTSCAMNTSCTCCELTGLGRLIQVEWPLDLRRYVAHSTLNEAYTDSENLLADT